MTFPRKSVKVCCIKTNNLCEREREREIRGRVCERGESVCEREAKEKESERKERKRERGGGGEKIHPKSEKLSLNLILWSVSDIFPHKVAHGRVSFLALFFFGSYEKN